jgi:hypothetical protein
VVLANEKRLVMKAIAVSGIVTAAIALAAPGRADVDTDFANQLQTGGISGPRDGDAWLGKIVCERFDEGLDANDDKSTEFLSQNLPRGTTQVQSWQFLGVAINTYCPDKIPVLQQVSVTQRGPVH